MLMDRKWIVLAALAMLLTVTGCSKKDPETTPPPPEVKPAAPTTDVPATPEPAEPRDVVEKTQPKSLADIQDDLTTRGLLGDVFYDFDRYELRAAARERLAKNAEFMKSSEGRNLTFTIEGHCDERGTNEYNLALGQNRATSALDYLESLGVARSRFQTISYGEERPFCTESSDACWQKNRRARFVVSGQNG
ncbi:MAG: OmpA family protein [Acidobacteriota bacterium]